MASPMITARKLRVAAVQLACEPAQTRENLSCATALIEQAATNGAELILLPELMAGGYTLTDAIWDTAERIMPLLLHNLRAYLAGDHAAMRNRVELKH